jgi:hypothetical protein
MKKIIFKTYYIGSMYHSDIIYLGYLTKELINKSLLIL